MVGTLHQISPAQLANFLRQPRLAYDYVSAPLFENPVTLDLAEKMMAEIQAKAEGFPSAFRAEVERVTAQFKAKSQARKGSQLVKPKADPEQERKELRLEKDWHVLHYLLNGTHDGGTGPLAVAVLGDKEIPDLDRESGYGPFRYLTPKQVKAVAEALAEVNPKELIPGIDLADAQSKKIYLGHTLDDAGWDYLPEFFSSFRSFYEDASRSGNAILVTIT